MLQSLKIGHILKNWLQKLNEKRTNGENLALKESKTNEIDSYSLKVNDLSSFGVFDAGSTHNLITQSLIAKLTYGESTNEPCALYIKMLYGNTIASKRWILLDIEYNILQDTNQILDN